VAQLELRVLPGTGLVVDHKPLLTKLGYGAGTTVDTFKNDIVKKTELNYAGKGLDADDARALAGILGSFGKSVDFRIIDLSQNKIGNVGMTAISEVIKSGALDGLEVLKLFNCGFGYKGFHAFTEIWLEYRTFRLIELTLGGIKIDGHFDFFDCLTEIDKMAEAGLANRMSRLQLNDAVLDMRGRTLRGGQKSSAGVPVIDGDQSIETAYETSATHVVMVVGAKSKAGSNGGYGSNPYYSSMRCRMAFLHLTGRDAGLVLIESSGSPQMTGSTANGVTTGDRGGGSMSFTTCTLTPLGATTFA